MEGLKPSQVTLFLEFLLIFSKISGILKYFSLQSLVSQVGTALGDLEGQGGTLNAVP